MFPPRHRIGAALVLALTVSALATACAAQTPPAAQPTETIASTPTTSAPEPSATPTVEAAGDPTCETLIGPDVVADFESIGWSSQAEKFYLGEVELVDGIQCVWADFAGPAGDHLQLFGWAEVTDEQAAEAQATLVSQGWVREQAEEGVYITEPKETTIAVDEEGYGMTYLFAAGTVKLADTKQGLLLIEWPKS